MKTIIGVMGPGRTASDKECSIAEEMGRMIAETGYTLLTGGVAHGVMHSASKGAKEAGGTTVGILPYKKSSETHPVSDYVDIAIPTNLGEARNVINVLACKIIVVIGICAGTMIEVCHAIKNGKTIIPLENRQDTCDFIKNVLLYENVHAVNEPKDAMKIINKLLN